MGKIQGVFAAVLLSAVAVGAQSLEPRFYSNAPKGLNFQLGGYLYSTGGATADPAIPLENAEIEIHGPFLAYARSFGLFGRSAKFDMVYPYMYLSGTAVVNGTPQSRKVEGFADPSFRFSYNFYGAPALTLEEFRDFRQNTVVGASLRVTAPWGQYDSSRYVNIGTHRWSFTPELGVSKRIGRCLFELAGSMVYFTDNDDYVGQKKEQDPLYAVQGHVVYLFKNKVWVAFDATRYTGGRTTVNGVERNDLQQSSRFGGTLAIPVTKRNSVKLYFSTGVETRTGSDFDTYGIVWQYRWGGGL